MINKDRLICYIARTISAWNSASIESQSRKVGPQHVCTIAAVFIGYPRQIGRIPAGESQLGAAFRTVMRATRITYLSAENTDNLKIVDSRRYRFARWELYGSRGGFMPDQVDQEISRLQWEISSRQENNETNKLPEA